MKTLFVTLALALGLLASPSAEAHPNHQQSVRITIDAGYMWVPAHFKQGRFIRGHWIYIATPAQHYHRRHVHQPRRPAHRHHSHRGHRR